MSLTAQGVSDSNLKTLLGNLWNEVDEGRTSISSPGALEEALADDRSVGQVEPSDHPKGSVASSFSGRVAERRIGSKENIERHEGRECDSWKRRTDQD